MYALVGRAVTRRRRQGDRDMAGRKPACLALQWSFQKH